MAIGDAASVRSMYDRDSLPQFPVALNAGRADRLQLR